jgi:hypothetical protein
VTTLQAPSHNLKHPIRPWGAPITTRPFHHHHRFLLPLWAPGDAVHEIFDGNVNTVEYEAVIPVIFGVKNTVKIQKQYPPGFTKVGSYAPSFAVMRVDSA